MMHCRRALRCHSGSCYQAPLRPGRWIPVIVDRLTLARALAVVLLVLVTLPRPAPAEWSPSRGCDRHLIARLLEGMDDQTKSDQNAFDQFVFLSDALTAMGCLPPRPTTGCIRVGALWRCAPQ
jgi:hypothetical protein